MHNSELHQLRSQAVPRGVPATAPVYAARARNAVITDVEGRDYIDFAAGIGVMNVGHCHPRVVEALKEQAELFSHTCFGLTGYEPYVRLAEKLDRLTPGDFEKRTFFVNSGAEAVENAIKVARYATGRKSIVAFEDGFHGRTYMTLSLTSQVDPYKVGFGPYASDVYRTPYAYCYRCPFSMEPESCDFFCQSWMGRTLETASTGDLAAVILEPYQGGAGFIFPPDGWLTRVQEWCRQKGVLFIVDEVQASFGRTGKLFAIEHEGLSPNMLCLGKGIGSGIPTAALMAEKGIMATFAPGEMSSTTGGNPVSCAAAHAVLDIMEQERLVESSAKVGAHMLSRLQELSRKHEVLGDARGKGLVIGLEFVRERQTKEPAADLTMEIIRRMCQAGVVCGRVGIYGNVIRVAPPLVITMEQADESIDTLDKVLAQLA